MQQDRKNKITGVQFPLKPYTVKQLSELYGISTKTFRHWLCPFISRVGAKQGYFYNISQVRKIVEFLGVPGNALVE